MKKCATCKILKTICICEPQLSTVNEKKCLDEKINDYVVANVADKHFNRAWLKTHLLKFFNLSN